MNKSYQIEFQNKDSNSTSSDLLILLTILKLLYAYGYIVVCIVSVLNNLIILLVFSKKVRNEIKISSSLLTDYSILAVLDIALMIIYYFPKWMGMKVFIRNIIIKVKP